METSFTGVLVRREYKPGQDYVQLLFKGAHDTKLSISRNVQQMKTLTIGGTYRLVGKEYKHGSKTYIRDPKATAVATPKSSKKKIVLIAALVLTCIALAGSLMAYRHFYHPSAVMVQPTTQNVTVESNTAEVTAPAEPVPATVPATTTTPAATTTKPKTTTKTTIPTTPTTVVTPTVSDPTPPASTGTETPPIVDDNIPASGDDLPPPPEPEQTP